MNAVVERPIEVEDLEELWHDSIMCEVDHEQVENMTQIALPGCGVVAAAELRDCQGRFFVCRPLTEFVEAYSLFQGVTCNTHGPACISIRWL